MIPYGKDNWRRNADTARGEWFAARGYALCRVDVRGTGSSGGVALDEYTRGRDRRTAYDAVEWLAAQPWCTGAVGMWGISYGGFTAIQVAKLRPPHLKAIVPFQATDDRYLTDVHYIGGCVTASELSQYAVSQVAMNAMPPDAAFRGDGWLDEWRARLEATPPWLFEWLRQQTDGPYWRHGSLAPDYDAIEAAILNVGGWNDSYVDAAFRMQARCTAPSPDARRQLGPRLAARRATPGPNLDELHEVVRFFDRWLQGRARTASTTSRRSSGSSATTPSRSRSRWRGRVAGGRRRRSRIRRPARSRGGSTVEPRRWSAGSCATASGGWRAAAGDRPIPAPADARDPRGRCRGAPAASRTASPATSGRTRASGPTYTSEPLDRARSRSSASPWSCSISRSTRRSRPPSCG